jgi:hypothetical protein
MASVTEIYVCKPGQDLKKGELFTSSSIHDRQAAENDARDRCREDDRIAKIGYYSVNEEGSFKTILIYENPNVNVTTSGPAPKKKASREELIASAQQARSSAPAAKSRGGLFSKVVTFFTEEAT